MIPTTPLQFPQLKSRLLRTTWILDVAISLVLAFTAPHWVMPFLLGSVLGYGYLWSLFRSVEAPKSKVGIILSILRMASLGFLIVWAGQFRLLETCVVFSGFLSYNGVLIPEVIRVCLGTKQSHGT